MEAIKKITTIKNGSISLDKLEEFNNQGGRDYYSSVSQQKTK